MSIDMPNGIAFFYHEAAEKEPVFLGEKNDFEASGEIRFTFSRLEEPRVPAEHRSAIGKTFPRYVAAIVDPDGNPLETKAVDKDAVEATLMVLASELLKYATEDDSARTPEL